MPQGPGVMPTEEDALAAAPAERQAVTVVGSLVATARVTGLAGQVALVDQDTVVTEAMVDRAVSEEDLLLEAVLEAHLAAGTVARRVVMAKVDGMVTTLKREKEKEMVSPGEVPVEARRALTRQVVLVAVWLGMIGADRRVRDRQDRIG